MAELIYSSSAGGWVPVDSVGPAVTPGPGDDLTVPPLTTLTISANLQFHSLTIGASNQFVAAIVTVNNGVTLTGDVTVTSGSTMQLGSAKAGKPAVLDGSLNVLGLFDRFAGIFQEILRFANYDPGYGPGMLLLQDGVINGPIAGEGGVLDLYSGASDIANFFGYTVKVNGYPGSDIDLTGSTTGAYLQLEIDDLAHSNFVSDPTAGGTVQISANIDNTGSTINLVQPGNAVLKAVVTSELTGGTLIIGSSNVVEGYQLSNAAILGTLNIPAGGFDLSSGSLDGTGVLALAGELIVDSIASVFDPVTINLSGLLDVSSGFNADTVTFTAGTVINMVPGGTIALDSRFKNSMVLQGDLNVTAAATAYTAHVTNPIGTVQFANGSAVMVGGLATLDINSALDNETTVQLAGGTLELDKAPGNLGMVRFFAPNSVLRIGTTTAALFGVTGRLLDFSDADTVLFAGNTYGAAAHFTLTANSLQVFDQNGTLDATFTLSRDDNQTYGDASFVLGSSSAGMTLTTAGLSPLVVPTITLSGAANFTGGGAPVALDPGIVLSDAASTTIAAATVSIGSDFSGDTLNFAGQNGIVGGFNPTSGVLSLSGTASLTAYQTALRSVTYSVPLDSDPTAGGGLTSRAINWTVNDGAVSSLETTGTLNVADPPPVLTAGAAVGYSEGGAPAVADSAVTVSDANSLTLAGASVAITGGTFVNDNDLLSADATGTAITTFYNPLNETLFLSGTDTLADYQKVLATVSFVYDGDDPANGGADPARTLTWTANNGVTNAASVTSTINVQSNRSLMWTGEDGANFADANNWNDVTGTLDPAASAPGSADIAGFVSGGGSIGGTGTATWLGFGGDARWTVTAGASLSAAAGGMVGLTGDGSLLIVGGLATGIVATGEPDQGFDIAPDLGNLGDVTVAGQTGLLTNTGQFVVGDQGEGSLTIQDGATVVTTPGTTGGLAGLVIANTASAAGSSGNVVGSGSNLQITGLLDIGDSSSGALSVSDGASVTAGSLDAGITPGAVANISVTDASLTVTGNATIADDGTGVLSVLSGATFTAANLTIGSQGESSGAVIVSGNGSVVDISGNLNVGTALGTGDLTIGPGGVVNAKVVSLQGQVVLENGELDPTVNLINQGQTAGGSGTIAAGDIVDEGVIQAGGSKPSQKLLVVNGTVLGGGPWTINGTAQAQVNGGAGILQINAGGTLELNGAVLNAGSTTFTDDVTPRSTYTVTNNVVDVNFADATGVLKLDQIAGFAGTIVAFQKGDSFVITGGTLSGLGVSNNNTLTISDSGHGGTDDIIFASPISAGGFGILNNNTIQVACFAAGTRIAAEKGYVPVEQLRAGDPLVTADRRVESIVWIGQRTVNCARHPRPETVWPVLVCAGAFGRNVPLRDLYLSPDHAVFVNNGLIPVKLLVNGESITQVRRVALTYYHIELRRHDVILAEGLPVESYLDTGDRANFHGSGEAIRLFPDLTTRLDAAGVWETRGAAALVLAGEALAAARAEVAADHAQTWGRVTTVVSAGRRDAAPSV